MKIQLGGPGLRYGFVVLALMAWALLAGAAFASSAFTPGNVAVLDLAANANDTTGSILELSPSTPNQASTVQTIPITTMSFATAGTSSFLALSNDGSLLVIAAYNVTNFSTTTASITAAAWATGTVTITAANTFTAGNSVTIAGMTPGGYNGTFTIASATATQITYALAANPGAATVFGAATSLNSTDLATDTAAGARGVGTLNASGTFNLATTYTNSISGNQTRCATSLDNTNFFIADHSGLYTNGATTPSMANNILNARSFGGVVYISTTKASPATTITAASWLAGVVTITVPGIYTVGDSVTIATMTPAAYNGVFTVTSVTATGFTYALGANPGAATVFGKASTTAAAGGGAVSIAPNATATTFTGLPGVASDGNIQDFYLIQSGSNGASYDVLYTLEANSAIKKFSLVAGVWAANGSFAMPNSGLSMIAGNNGAGGAFLYATTGTILEQFVDTAGFNATINVTAGPVTLYTASGSDFLKGLSFVPSSPTAPTVSSPTSTGVGINSATLGGDVTSTGSQYVSAYGVVYSLTSANANPTIGGTGVTNVVGSGIPVFSPFTISATGLAGTSGYSFAAYATNSVGTSYSSVGTFTTTSANPPTVDTPTDTSITNTSATLGGTVETNGGAAITKSGVVFALTSVNSNPHIGGAGVTEVDTGVPDNGPTTPFTVSATGLSAGSGYTFEAFATNSSGTTYAAATAFTTLAAPTVNTPAFTAVTSTSATLGGNVASNGGSSVTNTGVVYALTSLNNNPQIGGLNVTEVDTGAPVNSGVFTISATGLSAVTGYTFAAFATNSIGTTYTAATSFTTAAPGVIASWTFPVPVAPNDNSPTPTYGTGTLTTLGMNNAYNGGNTAADDVLSTPGAANGNFVENLWRVRGAPNNGWATFQNGAGAPQYSQGFQADTSTVGFSNIVFSFDWFSTTQGIRDLQVQYNTGSGWVNFQGPSPTGTFVTGGNDYYNAALSPANPTIHIDLSGIAAANGNPDLGIRLVSAFDSTGTLGNEYASAASSPGAINPYNNSSGNWRFGNLTFAAGLTTSTAVAASPVGSQNKGQNVTFTATVTPASGAQFPSGTVRFFAGNTLAGSANVSQVGLTNVGTASLTTSTLAPGVYNDITAQYTPAPGNGLIASGSSMNLVVGLPTNNPISYVINAPQATGVDISPVVNQSFTGVVATFTDGLTTNPAGFSATINWGDGSPTVPGVVAFSSNINETNISGATVDVIVFTVTGTHTYATAGNFTLSFTITDPASNTDTVNSYARVAHLPLAVTGVPAITGNAGGSIVNQAVATFTDPGLVANMGALGIVDPTTQFTASINWGDGATSAGTISFNAITRIFSVLGTHSYAQTGPYAIGVTVTPLTLSVARCDSSDPTKRNIVGDENGNGLTDAASAAFIDQFVIGAAGQGSSLYTVSLPPVSTPGSEALTYSSYSKTEGAMALSTNGQYLVVGGYNLTVNLWGPQSTFSDASVLNRVIATVNGAGVINTTTALSNAYSGDNFRGVVSTDGTKFWTCGHAGDNSDFVHSTTLGATTSTIITGPSGPNDINTIEIFNGQLYEGVRSVKIGSAGIYQIGSGLPTAAGQPQTLFIQVPQSNPLDVSDSSAPYSPFGFYMTALNNGNPTVNGVNVCYVADAEMGILRYDNTNLGWQFSYYISSTGSFLNSAYTVSSNGNVTPTGSFNPGNPSASADPTKAGGARALTGRVVNGLVQLFVLTGFGIGSEPNPGNSLIQLTDTGANSTFTTLMTNNATPASVLTGVAFTPFQTVTSSVTIAPVAFNGALSVHLTNVGGGALMATDPAGLALTYSIGVAAHGTATLTNASTGAYTYKANAGYVGADSFTFTATDGNATTNTAAITVTVTDSAPVASNGTLNVTGTTVTAGTLSATDADSDLLTYSIVIAAGKGTATITNASAGGYTYKANVGASGTDTFTFKTSDGALTSNTATVTVTITAFPAPVAFNGGITVTGTAAGTGTLLAIDANSSSLTYAIVANGTRGTATITNAATGAFSYTAATNAFATDSFTFKATDANGTSNIATISVAIMAQNITPIASISVSTGPFTAPAAVLFDGTASGPNVAAYQWNFGDGTMGAGATPTHTYAMGGTFTVTLTVINDFGTVSAPVTTVVTVITPSLPITSFSGKFGKSGSTMFKLSLNLPTGTAVGSSISVTIGTLTGSINKITGGKSGHGTIGSVKISGQSLAFTLKGSATALFGSPAPKTGTQNVNITVNGVLYQHSTTFTTTHATTTFK